MTDKEYETVTKQSDEMFQIVGATLPARSRPSGNQIPHGRVNPVTKQRAERMKSLSREYTGTDFRGSPCLTATAHWFGVRGVIHWVHFTTDFVRAMRKKGYIIRQRTSLIRKSGYTVSDFVTKVTGEMSATVTKQLAHRGEMPDYLVFIVWTNKEQGVSHIFATDFFGNVQVDTAPVKGVDNREVINVFGVWY